MTQSKLIVFCICVICASINSLAYSNEIDEQEFVLGLRALYANMQGASESTQIRLIGEYGRNIHGSVLKIENVLISRLGSNVSVIYTQSDAPYIRTRGSRGIYRRSARSPRTISYPEPSLTSSWQTSSRWPTLRAEAREMVANYYGASTDNINSLRFDYAYAEKDLQIDKLGFDLTIQDSSLVDKLREGQKVTIKLVVLGITGFTVFGDLIEVSNPVKTLQCANGHEFAPSAAFRFCPQCGEPLH